jgi:hypothetical protein
LKESGIITRNKKSSIIANTGTVASLIMAAIVSFFHNLGKYCKINLDLKTFENRHKAFRTTISYEGRDTQIDRFLWCYTYKEYIYSSNGSRN